jgi:hypothetical protein
MKEPGLDGRYRDQHAPKAGEIRQKRSDTLNGNLPHPIPEFRSDATLGYEGSDRQGQRERCRT